jgi:phosphoadenosine phosphosulfate reductase
MTSPRHTEADLAAWTIAERADLAWSSLARLRRMVDRAKAALVAFREGGPFYIGTSWGKDSLVVAHLAAELGLDVPVIWFPAGAVENPDCSLVRDTFLSRYRVRYIEHTVDELRWAREGLYLVHDGAQEAFAKESRKHGRRYASGVRAEESRARRLRMAHWGECSINTCAPIGHWQIQDVFAYLAMHDLPVHPAYACTWGGKWERRAIRVSTIGGTNGNGGLLGGNGRREWEESYYPEVMRVVREMSPSGLTELAV